MFKTLLSIREWESCGKRNKVSIELEARKRREGEIENLDSGDQPGGGSEGVCSMGLTLACPSGYLDYGHVPKLGFSGRSAWRISIGFLLHTNSSITGVIGSSTFSDSSAS